MTIQETANQYAIQPDTRLILHNLSERMEDGEYIIGRIETGDFIALPEVGKAAIDLFRKNYSIQDAHSYLAQRYDLDFDLESFVEGLIDLGFVRLIDGHHIHPHAEEAVAFPWLQSRHVEWIFSKPIKIMYLGLLGIVLFTIIHHPWVIPKQDAFFWSTSGSLVIFVNTILFITNLMLHELAHLIAARSLGVPAYINLGTRLHELVVQTNVTGLWSVPRKKRYRVYLAGIVWDIIPISISILLIAYTEIPATLQNILYSLILLIFFGIFWQFQFYMRTDIYFVILDLLRCYNLFDDSVSYIQYLYNNLKYNIFHPNNDKPVSPLENISIYEKRKIIIYSILIFFGSVISLLLFTIYGIPILLGLLFNALFSIKQGIEVRNLSMIVDGIIVILIEGLFQVLFIMTFIKNRKQWFNKQWMKLKFLFNKSSLQ
ncbi:MAG: hypothetical protein LCH85_01215 [Chloroflexi bacterium]|nr:hypothetical protein [Chloroflexota bacterium]